jgi:hypothetical protein
MFIAHKGPEQTVLPQLQNYYRPPTAPINIYRPNYMELLSEKFGEDKQVDGRPIHEDPVANQSDNDNSLSNDDSMIQMTSLQGERVDPHMRIY